MSTVIDTYDYTHMFYKFWKSPSLCYIVKIFTELVIPVNWSTPPETKVASFLGTVFVHVDRYIFYTCSFIFIYK